MDILFKNANIVTCDDEQFLVENAYLGIENGKIVHLSVEKPQASAGKVIDAKGKVLMPGLVNTHTHIPMSCLRTYAEDLALQEWLEDHIFKAEAKLDQKCIEISAKLTIAEMLSTGTTSFTDMYYKMPAIAKVVADTKIRANLCNGAMCFTPNYIKEDDNAYHEFHKTFNEFHNACDGKIKVDAGIHGEYTSNAELWTYWAKTAKELGVNLHVHVSETISEHEGCKSRHGGKTPVQVLSEHGVLDVPTNLAHCVHIEDEDMDILVEKGANVAHNPVSNLKLASGIANITKMLEKGISVTLGTDGVASNNTHDLFEEIKLAALLAKGSTNNPKAIFSKDVLKMATINGAKSQGRENLGMIKIGFDADIIMLDFDNIHHYPMHDIVSSLVYNTSGQDVCLTMVMGEILYEDGKFTTLDIEQIKHELENYVLPIIKK